MMREKSGQPASSFDHPVANDRRSRGREPEPPATQATRPTIHGLKVRPRNDQTDGGSSPTPYLGKSPPTSDVKHVSEPVMDGPILPAVPPLRPPD
jgi:hypothetical protein